MPDRTLSERLKAINADLQTQRAARAEALKERNSARDAFSKKDQLQENTRIVDDPRVQEGPKRPSLRMAGHRRRDHQSSRPPRRAS